MNGNHAHAPPFPQNMDEAMVQDDHIMDDEDDIVELDDLDLDYNERAADEEELDEYEMLTKVTDTSASLARKGKDIQGIPWDRLNITRDEYRSTRLEHYKNFENFPLAGEAVKEQCKRNQSQRQALNIKKSLFDQGFLDEQFVQLEDLQDEANPNYVEECVTLFYSDSVRVIHNIEHTLDSV